jgi:hypothetical protein
MAAGRIIIPNCMPALDINGNPVAGAKLTFYVNETTTLLAVYTSSALNVAHPNPVSADAAGAFPSIFADTSVAYSVAVTDADGLPITNLRNRDNVKAALFYGDDVVTAAAASAASAAADAASADADATATAADRVQTGLDRIATAADVVSAEADRVATAADRVQTGLDAAAAGVSAASAEGAVTTAVASITGALTATVVSREMGVPVLTAGAADFPDNYSWLLYQATEPHAITEIQMRIATVGTGAVNLAIFTGDPESGSMTFVRSVALSTVAATGDKTWANPDPGQTVLVGQWVGFNFPSGGVAPRRRNTGVGRAYYKTAPLTTGSAAFTVATGIGLEARVEYTATETSVVLPGLSSEVRGILSSVEAAGVVEPVWTGYGGQMTTVVGTFGAGSMLYVGTAIYAGLIEGLQFRVPTLGNGITRLVVARGTLSGRPVILRNVTLPTILSSGAVSMVRADIGDIMLEEGDHVFLMSDDAGPVLGVGSVATAVTFYFSAAAAGNPYAGMPLALSTTTGLVAQARFSQSVRNLQNPPAVTPTMWDIFLVAGQSNAVGASEGGGPVIQPGIAKQYYSSALTEILGDPVGGATYGSLCPAFVNEYYRRTGRGVILVPAALNGSPLLQATLGGTDNWSSTGTLRGTAITLLDAAKTAATSANLPWQFGGVIWVQGERDADAIDASTAGVSGANYITEFGLLNTYLNTNTGNVGNRMPILMVRTGHKDTGDTAGYVAIRAAQDTLARTHPNVFMAHTGAYRFTARGLMKDLYHYEQPAYDEIGVSVAMVAAARCVGCA